MQKTMLIVKMLDILIILALVLIVVLIGTGGGSFSFQGITIYAHDTKSLGSALIAFLILRMALNRVHPVSESTLFSFFNTTIMAAKQHLKGWRPAILLGLLIGNYIVVMGTVTVMRHVSYNSYAFDLGIFDQLLWNTVHGDILYSSILGDRHFFGEHVSPILLFISPLYSIYAHPISLLLFQTAALASGAIPLYLLAKKKLESTQLAMVLAGIYLCYQPLRNVNLFDFHEIALVTPLLLWAFLALDQRKYIMFGLFLTLSLCCKEEIATIVFIFGIYLAWVQRHRKGGAAVALIGIGVFCLEIWVIIPYFRHGNFAFVDRYCYLGQSIPEILQTLLLRPVYVLQHILIPRKIRYVVEVFGPVGFLSLLSPSHVLLAAPTLLQNLLSDYPPQYSIGYQYTAPLTPFVFISAIHGLRNLLMHPTFQRRFAHLERHHLIQGASAGLMLCCLASFGKSPIYHLRKYRITDHTRTTDRLLMQIPPTARVSAQSPLVPHLSQRTHIYEFPDIYGAEYIVLDTAAVTMRTSHEEYCRKFADLLDSTYGVVAMEDHVFILQQGYSSELAQTDIWAEFCKACQINACSK